jgi:hypothetical protein
MVKKCMLMMAVAAGGVCAQMTPEFLQKNEIVRILDEGRQASIGQKILLYPVNRFGDLMDVLTFQFGFGFGLHANVHATRLAQAGVGGSAVSRLGWDGRRFGLCNDTKSELSVLAASAEYYKRQNAFGFFKDYDGTQRPWLYRDHRDYWGVGSEATIFILNAGWEFHVKEVPDLFLGILGVDYRHDDFPKPQRGHKKPKLSTADARRVKKVVLCPSRIVSDSMTRMATHNVIGSYFYRYPREVAAGRFGEFLVPLYKNPIMFARDLCCRHRWENDPLL